MQLIITLEHLESSSPATVSFSIGNICAYSDSTTTCSRVQVQSESVAGSFPVQKYCTCDCARVCAVISSEIIVGDKIDK